MSVLSLSTVIADQQRLLQLLRAKAAREDARDISAAEKSLAEFVRQAWHVVEPTTQLEWGWHIDAICDHLEAVTRGDIKNLAITIPPGCTKSITVGVMWPAWTWLREPSTRWLCAGNEADIATRDSVACRRLIESEWYRGRWGDRFKLTTDQNVKTWYENDRRGMRIATTVGSNVTGKKGDILICDDPHDARKVESIAERNRVLQWWDHSFYNRVNNYMTGRRVMVGQRTHHQDLIGHILASGEFTELRVPEEFNAAKRYSTSIGWSDPRTESGEWLRPTRFGHEQKKAALKRLGTRGYATQHGQAPPAQEGVHFNPSWFAARYKVGDGLDTFEIPGKSINMSYCVPFVVLDPATGKGANGDCTGIGAFAWASSNDVFVREMISERIPIDRLVAAVQGMVRRWGAEYVVCEANGFQIYAVRDLRAAGLVVKEISPEGKGKLVRASRAIIMSEQGQIWLPAEGDWIEPFIDELKLFTGEDGGVDNQVDVLAYACIEGSRYGDDDGGGPRVLSETRRKY